MVVDGKATSTALRIAPGEALRISFPADDRCPDERVVSIDGPGAPTASVVVPCPGAGT